MNGMPLKNAAREYRPHYHGAIRKTGCNAVRVDPCEAGYFYALFAPYLHESKWCFDLLWGKSQ